MTLKTEENEESTNEENYEKDFHAEKQINKWINNKRT